jgi:putative transcriptional regulator
MREDDFNNLVKSIKQAGKIKNGQLKPGRTFEFNPMDIKAIRNKLHKSHHSKERFLWILRKRD